LAAWLDLAAPEGLLAFDHLPEAAPFAGRVLAISLTGRRRDWILWLRRGGAPPWADSDRAAAAALRTAWLEARLRHAEALAEERDAACARQAFLMAELEHRLKNILANIQAVLRHSRRSTTDIESFVRDFEARLRALATAHELLHGSRWEGTRLWRLASEELRPHADGAAPGRASVSGPDLMLRPKAALALSLALHELVTNAAKHGALSVPEGRVALRWRLTPTGLVLRWEEHGGPPMAVPARRGFGLTVIERSLAHELGGDSRLDFTPDGLRCTLCLPSAHLGVVR
jgi:two-component sensor histidine kinase